MTKPLKACPFCKSTELSHGGKCFGHGDYGPTVVCKCGAEMSNYLGDPADAWNQRAAPEVTNDDVVAALDVWFHQVKSPGLASYLNKNFEAFKDMTAILTNDRKRQRENL